MRHKGGEREEERRKRGQKEEQRKKAGTKKERRRIGRESDGKEKKGDREREK